MHLWRSPGRWAHFLKRTDAGIAGHYPPAYAQLALGLLNRMAPQLSIFVIGFPLTLTVGIMLMAALMPLIAPFCEHLFSEIFNLLADIVSEMPINNNP